MSSFLDTLQQPEYVHVLLNHLPLSGLFAAWSCLVAAVVLRSRTTALVGLLLVSLFSLSAWPTYVYGQRGYDRVYAMADRDGDAWLKEHRELAERWIWLYLVTGGLGIAGTVAGWKRPKWLLAAKLAVAILALSSLVAGAVIADHGGRVRHGEFRNGPPPAEPDG